MRAHAAVILYFMGKYEKENKCFICSYTGTYGCIERMRRRKERRGQLVPVTLNEVAHSVFYAPQYVAIEEGYFVKEE